MSQTRPATEDDFRAAEFRGAKVEDYEVRPDGKVVRKDRFEKAVYSVAYELGFSPRDGFEVPEVVELAKKKIALANKLTSQTPEQYILMNVEANRYVTPDEQWTSTVEGALVFHSLEEANLFAKDFEKPLGIELTVCALIVSLNFVVTS